MKIMKTTVSLLLLAVLVTSSVSFLTTKAIENISQEPYIEKIYAAPTNSPERFSILKKILHFLLKQKKQPSTTFKFTENNEGWTGDFSDLPINNEDFYELKFKHANIPIEGKNDKGLLLQGNNHSDDLFMYITRKFDKNIGLIPNTTYKIDLSFDIATNVPGETMGIGGSPGSSVYVKAGVVNVEPTSQAKNGYLRMNIDKANQYQSGKNMIVLGDIAKICSENKNSIDESFQYKHFTASFEITTNKNGEAWIIIGTDSGFEGLTELYYTNINVLFSIIE
ncbi:hypothetical protein [Clostridium sp. ZS2-4]|uniref:hypothetical protein n=1 Tax=Clostridium sp. ZS2-4 TaxID=2987703 RepID=UPI00227BE311|nr:hypothetical protein [Clostridium sp. ZS2-4]MCY6356529.1 hypothetical protein [Clostridium sp. ZS2-4]